MKTGTTYLQDLMANNRRELRSQGVLVPGQNPRSDQVRAVRDVMDLHPEADTSQVEGAWARLREEMLGFDGRASVVSQEFMSFARKPRAKALVDSLAPATVHVVLTVRDTARVLPSSWATSTRNRSTLSWQEFMAALLVGPKAGGTQWRRSMRAVDVPRMLRDWGGLVPAERLHVVVVPPSGAPPGMLWQRFAAVLDVDPQMCDSNSPRRGESYGYHSADFMRRVNTHLQGFPKPVYHSMKRYLLDEVLDKRTGEPRIPVTRQVSEFAEGWNAEILAAIRSSGARVYGDLADLAVTSAPVVETAQPPSAEDLLPVAADALSGLRHRVGTPGDVTPAHWASAADPVAAAARDVADAMCAAAAIRRGPDTSP